MIISKKNIRRSFQERDSNSSFKKNKKDSTQASTSSEDNQEINKDPKDETKQEDATPLKLTEELKEEKK